MLESALAAGALLMPAEQTQLLQVADISINAPLILQQKVCPLTTNPLLKFCGTAPTYQEPTSQKPTRHCRDQTGIEPGAACLCLWGHSLLNCPSHPSPPNINTSEWLNPARCWYWHFNPLPTQHRHVRVAKSNKMLVLAFQALSFHIYKGLNIPCTNQPSHMLAQCI